jgi:hypothetical protein
VPNALGGRDIYSHLLPSVEAALAESLTATFNTVGNTSAPVMALSEGGRV